MYKNERISLEMECFSSLATPSMAVGPRPRLRADYEYIIRYYGCSAILNLCQNEGGEREEFIKILNSVKKDIIKDRSNHYLHVSINDGMGLDVLTVEKCFLFIDRCFEKKERVYVHCHAGMSRSPGMIIAVLVAYGYEPHDCKRLLENRHPVTCIHPEIWTSILNNAESIKKIGKGELFKHRG